MKWWMDFKALQDWDCVCVGPWASRGAWCVTGDTVHAAPQPLNKDPVDWARNFDKADSFLMTLLLDISG